MSYSKHFNPARYEPIAKVLEAVQALRPGGRLTITGASSEELGQTRYLVYDFLWHMGLKEMFRLRTLGEGTLLIQRLGLGDSVKVEIAANTKRGEMIETLIELWDTEAAKDQLKEWVDSRKISAEDGDELWTSVQKIMA